MNGRKYNIAPAELFLLFLMLVLLLIFLLLVFLLIFLWRFRVAAVSSHQRTGDRRFPFLIFWKGNSVD